MWKRIDLLYFQHNIIWRLRQLEFDHYSSSCQKFFYKDFVVAINQVSALSFFRYCVSMKLEIKISFFKNKVSQVKIPKLAFGSLGILNLFELVRKCVKASEINFYDR